MPNSKDIAVDSWKRRDFINLLILSGTAFSFRDFGQSEKDYEPLFEELSEVVWGNTRIGSKAWDVVEGFTEEDLNYWNDNFTRIKENLMSGGDVDGFQSFSPDVAAVSTPEDMTSMRLDGLGRVSGFMSGGAEQIPFEPTRNLNTPEGVFAGLKDSEDLKWLPFDAEVHRSRLNAGEVRYRFELQDFEVVQDASIVPGEKSGRLDFEVKNTSGEYKEADFLAYGRASANSQHQNPIFFKSEPNAVNAGEGIEWESLDSESNFTLETDAEVSSSGVFRPVIENWFTEYRDQEDFVDNFFEFLLDKLMEESGFAPDQEGSDFQSMFEDAVDEIEARYGSGYLMMPLGLEPGETLDLNVWLNGEPQERSAWRVETPDFHDELEANLLMHTHENGMHAAHNIQPMYYPTWIRDSVFSLEVLMNEGHTEHIRDFYMNVLPDLQRENGSFNQCFYPDGSETGTWYSELDQPSIMAAKFPEVDEKMDGGLYQDPECRQMYVAALARILQNLNEGKLNASPDFAEQPQDFFKQSLWTQSYAHESLSRAAKYDIKLEGSELENIPSILHDYMQDDEVKIPSELLETRAEEIKQAIESTYFQGRKITNDGLIRENKSKNPVYAKVLEDTSVLQELGRDEEFLESLEQRNSGEYWTPGFAAYGKALDMYGQDNSHVKDSIRSARTDLGKLPERVRENSWRDAMELAWGSAEALDLLRNH